MNDNTEPTELDDTPDRWTLIRDIAVFQVKLLVDGFRDLLLVPVSLVVGLVSLFRGGSRPGNGFYELLLVGRRSEHWINLFGAADRAKGNHPGSDLFPDEDIDGLVSRVESFVVDEYRKGGVTAQAKDRMDSAIDTLHRMGRRPRKPDSAEK
jgi:hypothetical protein